MFWTKIFLYQIFFFQNHFNKHLCFIDFWNTFCMDKNFLGPTLFDRNCFEPCCFLTTIFLDKYFFDKIVWMNFLDKISFGQWFAQIFFDQNCLLIKNISTISFLDPTFYAFDKYVKRQTFFVVNVFWTKRFEIMVGIFMLVKYIKNLKTNWPKNSIKWSGSV